MPSKLTHQNSNAVSPDVDTEGWRQFPDLALNSADRTIAAVCALYRSVLELEEIVDHLRCEINSHIG